MVAPAVTYDGKRMPVRRPPPWLSQHTDEVCERGDRGGCRLRSEGVAGARVFGGGDRGSAIEGDGVSARVEGARVRGCGRARVRGWTARWSAGLGCLAKVVWLIRYRNGDRCCSTNASLGLVLDAPPSTCLRPCPPVSSRRRCVLALTATSKETSLRRRRVLRLGSPRRVPRPRPRPQSQPSSPSPSPPSSQSMQNG